MTPHMEEIVKQLLAAGSAGAVIIVVFMFIRHLEKMRTLQTQEQMSNEQFLAQLHNEHLDERKLTRAAISENNVLLRENSKVLTALTGQLERRES